MTLSLHDFATRVRGILQENDTPAGRTEVAALLADALKDRHFVDGLFDDTTPERKVVYQDPQLGFCILAHRYTDARDSGPHDHGPSWAIYGQADGETLMSDWVRDDPASTDTRAKVRKVREYKLTPGVAHVYNEGDIHAPSRAGATRLVRIEGVNLEGVRRGTYERV
jgi:predicted metal-dependent enzyme (double-stranded beta helix superfamily)